MTELIHVHACNGRQIKKWWIERWTRKWIDRWTKIHDSTLTYRENDTYTCTYTEIEREKTHVTW